MPTCDALVRKIAADRVYVLDVDALLAGVIVFGPSDGAALHVETLAVPPRLQRMGIGTKLIGFACERARRADAIELVIYADAAMSDARGFLERLGFARFGERVEAGGRRVYFRLGLSVERPMA